MNWNIITDSSCDLLPSTSPDGRIRLTSVPFTIRIGERDFVDDEHLDMLEMLSAMEQERSAGHTSCPTPDAWLAQFEQADCAIAITISSQLSGSRPWSENRIQPEYRRRHCCFPYRCFRTR